MLLFPFAVVYDLITRLRNHLYDIGQKRSFEFDTTVISVGNLSAGGSGKTPMIEYLLRFLAPGHRTATLSRGYGRRTRGFRIAGPADDATTLGDEPFQFFRKFGHHTTIAVGEERALAIPRILHGATQVEVILMDDAFQHRPVRPQLSVLLTDYNAPFYTDFVLPAGNLRESRKGAQRADVIVVTKCPETLPESEQDSITTSVRSYAIGKPVFFTGLNYDLPVAFDGNPASFREVILVSGIANATTFEAYARSAFTVVKHFAFGDHHRFTAADLERLEKFRQRSATSVFLTTEKDMVRLIGPDTRQLLSAGSWYYLPVRITFLKNGSDFDNLVLRSLKRSS